MALVNTSSQATTTPNPNESHHEEHDHEHEHSMYMKWPYAVSINTFMILVCVWFLYCFVKYDWKKKASMSPPLNKSAILSCTCVLIHLFSTEALIIVGQLQISDSVGDQVCNILYKMHTSSYYICSLPIFVFFWMRQRFLYKQQQFPIKHTSLVLTFSWVSFVLHISGIVVAGTVEHIYIYSHFTDKGCVKHSEVIYESLPYTIFEGAEITSQTIIFVAVYHALKSHKQVACTINGTCSLPKYKLKKRIFDISRRASISIFILVITNIIGIVLVASIPPFTYSASLEEVILDTILLFNIVSIVFSYDSVQYEPLFCISCRNYNRSSHSGTNVISITQV